MALSFPPGGGGNEGIYGLWFQGAELWARLPGIQPSGVAFFLRRLTVALPSGSSRAEHFFAQEFVL
jgi:hypothetical protein